MIQNKEFKNRIEVEQHFIEIWDLPLINNEINLAFFYDKKIIIFDRKQKINIISTLNEIFYDGKIFRIKSNEKYNYPLSYVTIEMINPITNKLEKINLSRLISKKFYVSDKVFKSFYYKTKEYQDKINNTSINRYGKKIIEVMKEKGEKTFIEKYGVKNFLVRGDHYDQTIKKIMIEKYGTEIPLQNEELKQKISNTIKEKYGVDWFLKRGKHYKKITDILIEKYGYENPLLNNNIHKKSIDSKLNSEKYKSDRLFYKNKKIQERLIICKQKKGAVSKFEINAISWLLESFEFEKPAFYSIDECTNQCVIRSENLSKKYYKVDFYDSKLNLVIEFNGDYWHANPKIYKPDDILNFKFAKKTAKEIWAEDLKRKNEIINVLNCSFIEIWENDFNNNKEKIKNILYEYFENKIN